MPDDVTARHKTYNYRIRQYASSVIPNPEQEIELIQLTARIPFDDRVNSKARVNAISFALMREHLAKVNSRIYETSAVMSVEELADSMNLCEGAQEHLFPKNGGLLMFSENPEHFFPSVQIDVVEFPYGVDESEFYEKTFYGPIQKQLTDALSYIQTNIIKSKVIKYADKAEADKIFNYPYVAIEEALANAVYHRNYELRNPIEVRVLPDAIEIVSFSGIDPSLKQADFERGVVKARRYRNRRIGGFLKELELTEGRGTGIPTIFKSLKSNGSPPPIFDTNEPERIYFLIEIRIHPDFEEREKVLSPDEKLKDKNKTDANFFGMISERIRKEFGKDVDSTFRVISKHPEYSAQQIADIIGKTPRTIENYLAKLKDRGIIKRKGAKLGGHWEIIAEE